MFTIAEKFKAVGQDLKRSQSASSIFGAASNLSSTISNQSGIRVGFYPIIDRENPEFAMGIASCLCYLLEQYPTVRLYRIFAKIDNNESDEVDISDSQFMSEEWEFEGLDYNIVISGSLIRNESGNQLKITVDQALRSEKENNELAFSFTDEKALINNLPDIAAEISKKFDLNTNGSELIISYLPIDQYSDQVQKLLEGIFYWNLDIYLYLWDVEWEDEDIVEQFRGLIKDSASVGNNFAAWCLSMAARQVMQLGLDAVGDLIVPLIDEILDLEATGNTVISALGSGLIKLGYIEQAVSLVESEDIGASADILGWISRIDIYTQANKFSEAINANQQAIENGIEDIRLYWRYIQLVRLAEQQGWFVEELLLIDPEEINEDEHLRYEIIAALENIIALDPKNISAIHMLLPMLIETDDFESLWQNFEILASLDVSTHYLQDIIPHMYDLDNLQPGLDILIKNAEQNTDNPYTSLTVAQLAAIDENTTLVEQYLEKCGKFIESYGATLELDIQLVKVTVEFPDFEHELSEINTILAAQRPVTESHVDFLEEALEIATKIGTLYVTLAKCYLSWNDTEAAIQVLNDGKREVGQHPELLLILAQIMWKQNKKQEAFEYLNDGLKINPNDISLLIQVAYYLIENEQMDDAKPYIERADIIAPSNQGLWELKKTIAEKTMK